jgi:hypothetical protein
MVPPNVISSIHRESKGTAVVTVPLEVSFNMFLFYLTLSNTFTFKSKANHWMVMKV